MEVTNSAIRVRRCLGSAALWLALVTPAHAQSAIPSGAGIARPEKSTTAPDESGAETYQARWQTTFVYQRKPAFDAAYSGPNSLVPNREQSHSWTATAMLGVRPWAGGEIYLNPEIAAGVPLSNLTGLGGFPNGELARTSGPDPKLYLARLFLRQTWGFGGERQRVDSDQNQMRGAVDARRLVLTAGLFPLIDVFDDNAYSHDSRTQFMNWAIVTHGSFDFAADARGYTRGVALEWFYDDWAVRIGRFAMPRESNGLQLNYALGRSYGDQIELERGYSIGGQPGKVRILSWRNRASMGRFDDAIAQAAGGPPSVALVRRDQTKGGWGINFEQTLGQLGGAFMRLGRSDDRTEAFAYSEIGASLSGGVLIAGANWNRPDDSAGIAMVRNELSASHRNYLAAGGLGFFVGDGRLNYRPERIVEVFYALGVLPRAWITLNAQHIDAPAYNADRGPVNVFGVRFHTNF